MGIWRRRLRRFINWWKDDGPPKEPPKPIYDFSQADFGSPPSPPPEFTRRDQDLPDGWKFEGLYFADLAPADRRQVNTDPSDWQISQADAIIVSYTDSLGTIHRTIHGADSRADVGKLINRVTAVVSPPR